uniref:DH domain-containing protein n=1 Tax=Romanomermis culicivorax TaxID=13658 RepID=A0A915J792_ROMCU
MPETTPQKLMSAIKKSNKNFVIGDRTMESEMLSQANAWCTKGVELLTNLSPLLEKESESKKRSGGDGFILHSPSENDRILEKEDSSSPVTSSGLLETRSTTRRTTSKLFHSFDNLPFSRKSSDLLTCEDLSKKIDDFLTVGHCLKFDSFGHKDSEASSLINEMIKKSSVVGKEIITIPTAKVQTESCSNELPDLVVASSNVDHLPSKVIFILDELLTTEKIYVQDLVEITEFYSKPFFAEYKTGDSNDEIIRIHQLIFGNLDEILTFHSQIFLPQLAQACRQCPRSVAHCFEDSVIDLTNLYETYCRNKSREDQYHKLECFQDLFQKCQVKAGHLLPLSAYLLKPVQRITKYQLLLQEMAKCCRNRDDEYDVSHALQCMLDLLSELNSSFVQTKITGYPSNVYNLGPTLINGPFIVWQTKRQVEKTATVVANLRRNAKAQRRHLFLFENFLILCKTRRQSSMNQAESYYEFKMEINISTKKLLKNVRLMNELEFDRKSYKFALSISNSVKSNLTSSPSLATVIFVCQPMDSDQCALWIEKMEKVLSSTKKTAVVDFCVIANQMSCGIHFIGRNFKCKLKPKALKSPIVVDCQDLIGDSRRF